MAGGGRQLADRPRARRRDRRDHPLELSPAPDRREGRARDGRGVHRGAQAIPGRAAERRAARRGDRRGRPARGRLQPRHRSRRGHRRGARAASRRGHDLLHRVHRGGPAGQRSRRRHDQARRARAGRQVAERHPRGRRPPGGHPGRRCEVLPELRTDLQRPHQDARAALATRRGRADRRHRRRALQAG